MSRVLWSNAAAVSAVFSLTLAVLGFATEHWIDFSVDENKFKQLLPPNNQTEALYHGLGTDRSRGLLKECYKTAAGYLNSSKRKLSENCAWVQYDIPQKADFSSKSSEYQTHIHLVRLCGVALGVAMLMLFLSFISHIASGCCDIQRRSSFFAGILCIVAFLMLCAALVAFLVAYYEYEKRRVKDSLFYLAAWPQGLLKATSDTLGWSFWVSVVSIPLSAIAAVLFLVAYNQPTTGADDQKALDDLEQRSHQSEKLNGRKNGVVEMYDRDAHSLSSAATGQGRVIKQQVYKRTIDPTTGRELGSRLNNGYDISDDNSSLRGSRYEDRLERAADRGGPVSRSEDAARGYYRAADSRPEFEQRRLEARTARSAYSHEPRRDYEPRDRRARDYRAYEKASDNYF